MQHDVSTPPTPGETYGRPRGEAGIGTRELQPIDYLSASFNTVTGWFGQLGAFLTQQTRERPLVVGFLFMGTIGAMVGAWIARVQSMRRHRSPWERAMDVLGYAGAFFTGWMPGRSAGPLDTLRERGQDVLGSTIQGIPGVGRPRAEIPERPESFARQVGYALSLIPITLAFLRNPLVRDISFRYLSRRFARR